MKMAECKSTTWNKLLEIPTRAKTVKGQIEAIRKFTDCFAEMDDDEIEEYLASEWCTICEDGIVVWVDGE